MGRGAALSEDLALAEGQSEAAGIEVSFENTWLWLLELRVPGSAWPSQALDPV